MALRCRRRCIRPAPPGTLNFTEEAPISAPPFVCNKPVSHSGGPLQNPFDPQRFSARQSAQNASPSLKRALRMGFAVRFAHSIVADRLNSANTTPKAALGSNGEDTRQLPHAQHDNRTRAGATTTPRQPHARRTRRAPMRPHHPICRPGQAQFHVEKGT